MKVLPTQTGDAVTTPVADTRTDAANTRAFKAALAHAATDTSHAGTDVTTTTTAATDGNVAVKLRTGETMEHVEGHAYAEITAGSREGMFINTSGNVRNGQSVRAGAQERQGVPRLRHRQGPARGRLPHAVQQARRYTGGTGGYLHAEGRTSRDIKLRKGEKIEPVEGHAYAEITSGPRSGMYINTTGNSRRGEAFVLVEKSGFDYHIYGSGDDRDRDPRETKRDDDDK